MNVLNALQLATVYEFGALSPCLQSFEWPSPQHVYWPGLSVEQISSHMSLFLGDSVRRLVATWFEEGYPLYLASVMFHTKRLTNVKDLHLVSEPYDPDGVRYLTSFPWSSLETIILDNLLLSIDTPFPGLAKLPHLRHMEIVDSDGALAELSTDEIARVASACRSNPTSFPSLRVLIIRASHLYSTNEVLQFLPPGNQLERLKIAIERSSDYYDCREAIDAAERYCNPQTLQRFQFHDCSAEGLELDIERVEPDKDELDIDLWKLCKFRALTNLTIRSEGHITLRPRDIPRISASWPGLRYLDLCSTQHSRGRMPALDHTHLLEILQGCPSLRHLGLRFDTTQLSEDDLAPSGTFRLRTLRVGESPIHWPSRVVTFIKKRLPLLMELDATYLTPESAQRPNMLDKRWAEVVKSLFQIR